MSSRDFTNIAVGDTVLVRTSRSSSLHRVAKVTKTQFTIETGTRFLRSGGSEYGATDRWSHTWAVIPDPLEIAHVKAEQQERQACVQGMSLCAQIDALLRGVSRSHKGDLAPVVRACNEHLQAALKELQDTPGDAP